jgi:hypothetical protein
VRKKKGSPAMMPGWSFSFIGAQAAIKNGVQSLYNGR